jgi:hypothetical protein
MVNARESTSGNLVARVIPPDFRSLRSNGCVRSGCAERSRDFWRSAGRSLSHCSSWWNPNPGQIIPSDGFWNHWRDVNMALALLSTFRGIAVPEWRNLLSAKSVMTVR